MLPDLSTIEAKVICNVNLLEEFATFLTQVEVNNDLGGYKPDVAKQHLGGVKKLIEKKFGNNCFETFDAEGCAKGAEPKPSMCPSLCV